MGWPVNSNSDEAKLKWKIAMKFLFPAKFDSNRALNLYRAHEVCSRTHTRPLEASLHRRSLLFQNIRKSENLDRIWINNPQLVSEIQSSKFFSLVGCSSPLFVKTNRMSLALIQDKLANQALTVYFTAANLTSVPSASTLSSSDREIVTLQALVCQLDVATERFVNAC